MLLSSQNGGEDALCQARSARRCTCGSARTHRRWKIKSASFGKSPGGVVGTSWRSTATRASQARRDETDGLASIPCSRTPADGNSISSWLGRLTAFQSPVSGSGLWPVLGYLLGENYRRRDRDRLVPP